MILSGPAVVESAEGERLLREVCRGRAGQGRRCAVLAGGLPALGHLSFHPLGGGRETPQPASWSRFKPPAGVRAEQCFEREGHLRVPRKHVETIVGRHRRRGPGGTRAPSWIGNQRSRAATLTPSGWNSCPPSACAGRNVRRDGARSIVSRYAAAHEEAPALLARPIQHESGRESAPPSTPPSGSRAPRPGPASGSRAKPRAWRQPLP